MKSIIGALITVSLFACTSQKSAKDAAFDVSTLTTIELREQFLNEIYLQDQLVRENEADANQQFGYKSKEHLAAINEMVKYDQINLPKIEAYLKEFGYPNKSEYSSNALATPWLVIHHAQSETSPRRRNFKYIYAAY